MEAGNDRYGSGKVLSCRKAVAHTVSFSNIKRRSSAVNGGLISAITGVVSIRGRKREVLRK